MLKVTDALRLQQTLSTLLRVANIEPVQSDAGGITYYSVRIPSSPTSFDIGYPYVDAYLIVGSSLETPPEAIRLRRRDDSLRKPINFLAAVPPGHPPAP